MIACLLIPGFELRAVLAGRPESREQQIALEPLPGSNNVIGPVTAKAAEAGVRPGMRLGEALSVCPRLCLLEPDPALVEAEWEHLLRRLEDVGIAVEPEEPGCLYFETRHVERLYRGLEQVLERALLAVGPFWESRLGAAGRRFAALAAASVARPGQALIVPEEQTEEFLAPLPLELLPMPAPERERLQELGLRTIGQLVVIPGGVAGERLGREVKRAWELARGELAGHVRGRSPAAEIAESIAFPEAVANELTLRRTFSVLVERLLARPERGGRFIRSLALSARLAGGGSWRRKATLRQPSADRGRIVAALSAKLAEIPAPVFELGLELETLAEETGEQLQLAAAGHGPGGELEAKLAQGLKQVRASTGSGSVCSVVEVAPWSRIPEARALLVPRDE
ncbi:MAG: DinB/UmuC family translesion DNA polymerase [Gaiellaceae bacterium]